MDWCKFAHTLKKRFYDFLWTVGLLMDLLIIPTCYKAVLSLKSIVFFLFVVVVVISCWRSDFSFFFLSGFARARMCVYMCPFGFCVRVRVYTCVGV